MAFNVMAYNRDDHTKQVAFLMDKAGQWHLSPAYDMTYAFNPAGDFTNSHQMTINRRRDGIGDDDLLAVAHRQGLNRASARRLLNTVRDVTGQWRSYAVQAQVPEEQRDKIARLIAQG
jgi:serine/threonine-protein kinase HipA